MDDRSSKPGKGNRTEKRGKGTRDVNEVAFAVVQQATGQAPKPEPEPEKNPAAVSLGRLGGLKGGKARADSLSPSKRRAIARKAAAARWRKK
jgi:hypothetical protein